MEELIAKRYLKAIKQRSNAESMQSIALIFSVLAESFNNERFNQIINKLEKKLKTKIFNNGWTIEVLTDYDTGDIEMSDYDPDVLDNYFRPNNQKNEYEKQLKKKYVTISFDDGFINNLTNALPLLEKYNVPATFFISTNYSLTQSCW